MRYAKEHQLNLVLPKERQFLGPEEGFTVESLQDTAWFKAKMQPQIFCLHNRWNGQNVAKLYAPFGKRPYYFTILRDPVALFISLWDYEGLSKKFKGMTLQEFALSPDKPEKIILPGHLNYKHPILWDFGVPVAKHDNEAFVRQKIREIDETFDLVMMVEHWKESMVFLRQDLCWDYSDLASLHLNMADEESKSKNDQKARNRLKDWLKTSYIFYDFFKVFKILLFLKG